MTENPKRLLVDSPIKEVCDELFFLKPNDIKFWLANEDFKTEYHRLYDEGEKDGFYLFYLASGTVYGKMTKMRENDPDSCLDFDFKTAISSLAKMKKSLLIGFDNRVLNSKLNFIIGRIPAPVLSTKYWLATPEFAKEINSLVSHGKYVDKASVYSVMKKVWNEKLNEKINNTLHIADPRSPEWKQSTDRIFSFRIAKSAARALEKDLGVPPEQRLKSEVLEEKVESIPEPDQVSDSK